MQAPKKNALEWSVFALGLVLVLGTLGFLAWDAATHTSQPPELQVRLGRPRPEGNLFIVPVTVENTGDRTAEGVEVEVTLTRDGRQVETTAFTVAFVPRGSSRDGFVVFREDPGDGTLQARAVGYEAP